MAPGAWMLVAKEAGSAMAAAVYFVKKRPWQSYSALATIALVICLMTRGCGDSQVTDRTVTTRVDTLFTAVDTNKVRPLNGWSNENVIVRVDTVIRFKSPRERIPADAGVRDSLDAFRAMLESASLVIKDCDSALREETAMRSYSNTVRDSAIAVDVSLNVRGRVIGEPVFSYRKLLPDTIFRETITITERIGPQRSIWLEAGAGPRFDFNADILAVPVEVGVGYMGKKGWGAGVRGDVSHKDWSVKAVIRRDFKFGK